MDEQDGQDKQDEKLLRKMLTRSTFACAIEVIHKPASGILESLLKRQ